MMGGKSLAGDNNRVFEKQGEWGDRVTKILLPNFLNDYLREVRIALLNNYGLKTERCEIQKVDTSNTLVEIFSPRSVEGGKYPLTITIKGIIAELLLHLNTGFFSSPLNIKRHLDIELEVHSASLGEETTSHLPLEWLYLRRVVGGDIVVNSIPPATQNGWTIPHSHHELTTPHTSTPNASINLASAKHDADVIKIAAEFLTPPPSWACELAKTAILDACEVARKYATPITNINIRAEDGRIIIANRPCPALETRFKLEIGGNEKDKIAPSTQTLVVKVPLPFTKARKKREIGDLIVVIYTSDDAFVATYNVIAEGRERRIIYEPGRVSGRFVEWLVGLVTFPPSAGKVGDAWGYNQPVK